MSPLNVHAGSVGRAAEVEVGASRGLLMYHRACSRRLVAKALVLNGSSGSVARNFSGEGNAPLLRRNGFYRISLPFWPP
jgi:hypothetical protein